MRRALDNPAWRVASLPNEGGSRSWLRRVPVELGHLSSPEHFAEHAAESVYVHADGETRVFVGAIRRVPLDEFNADMLPPGGRAVFTFPFRNDAAAPLSDACVVIPELEVVWPARQTGRSNASEIERAPHAYAYVAEPARPLGERPPASGVDPCTDSLPEPTTKSDYLAAVERYVRDIGTGDYAKAVATRIASGTRRAADSEALSTLRARYEHATVFRVAGHSVSMIGATPELLVRVEGDRAETMALAGTATHARREDLERDKELQEHNLVVDAIARVLRCEGLDATIGKREFASYGDIVHASTPIKARGEANLIALARALHPTPAVGGYPRRQALQAIANQERHERGLYTGVIGTVDSNGDGAAWVVLRCAMVSGDQVRLFAGAGIVAGSDSEAEWVETERKLNAMRTALNVNEGAS